MTVKTLTLDGKPVSAREDETILDLCREHGVPLPTLCHLEGLSSVGACRLCLVEVKGQHRLQPACTLRAEEGMEITTASERVQRYRRQIVELLFAERNHVCAICVVNGHCELQEVAYSVGMDHVRYAYQHPPTELDASHPRFVLDRVITDLCQPWGKSESCTSCGKCVQVCPTGSLFEKLDAAGGMVKNRSFLTYIKNAREKKQWIR